jgi:hypothetical protein
MKNVDIKSLLLQQSFHAICSYLLNCVVLFVASYHSMDKNYHPISGTHSTPDIFSAYWKNEKGVWSSCFIPNAKAFAVHFSASPRASRIRTTMPLMLIASVFGQSIK